MKFYVYILKSSKNNNIYIGSAQNVSDRIKLHNIGRIRSTKGYRPWKLLEIREFSSRSNAVREERFLKNHQQKDILKQKYAAM